MSARRELTQETESGWITTFADLMTLLLVFFVLLFSMSTVEKVRFASTVQAFQKAIGDNQPQAPIRINLDAEQPQASAELDQPLPTPGPQTATRDLPVDDNQELITLSESLKSVFAELGVQQAVDIGAPKDGKIRIRVKGEVLFESGDTTFKRQMLPVLDGIAEMLYQNRHYKVDIQGHTDNIPIATARFPSNWELSAVRATTVLRYFLRGGIAADRVTATGYGDSLPLYPNDSAVHRSANRRIEFVLEKD